MGESEKKPICFSSFLYEQLGGCFYMRSEKTRQEKVPLKNKHKFNSISLNIKSSIQNKNEIELTFLKW
jgi:hypothetical protein